MRDYADELRMTGGTALYDSVLLALEHMLEQKKKNPNYQYSVVAFTDGENNKGRNLEAVQGRLRRLPEDVRGIPVFMVLFGEANEADLKATGADHRRPRVRCAQDAAVRGVQGHPRVPMSVAFPSGIAAPSAPANH